MTTDELAQLARTSQAIQAKMKRRCLRALQRRAQFALMFYPPDKLRWQYIHGEDAPRLMVDLS